MKSTNKYKQNILIDRVLVVACLAGILGLASCQQKGTAEKAGKKIDQGAEKVEQQIKQKTEQAEKKIGGVKESVTDKTEKAGEYMDDSAITLEVKTAILNDASLKASKIEVATVNGIVKLSGTVDSEQSINRVIELANSQKNVESVQTDLVINANAD